ncbi:hypothetical protein AB9N12_19440 [Bacteroides sp. AN502(2024)]|uniref:hypothetical protein n=1 Tax=Bacteroides sp. AN502(2024) TaxID=3160599 RepID=UPI003515CFF3
MEEKRIHYALGLFIAEQLKRAKIDVKSMCKELHMSLDTYEQVKRGLDKALRHYIRIMNYYYDNLTKEEFLAKMAE